MFRFSNLLLVTGVLAIAPSAMAGISLTFDTPGEFAANFSTAQTVGLISQTNTGGLGDSGRIDWSPIAGSQIWTLNTSFQGNLPSWSAEFYMQGTIFSAFGFTTLPNPGDSLGYPTNSEVTGYLPSIFIATATPDVLAIVKDGDTNVLAAQTATSQPLTERWYRYRIAVENLGLGNYDVTGTVYTADGSGAIFSQIGSVQAIVNNPALAADGDVHLFLGFNEVGNSIDNFQTTIPEPASVGLLTLSAGLMLRRRRK
jgi:hypothetical protein